MHIHLLGYSENALSRILDSLALHGYAGEIVIVMNVEVQETIPFCPPGITYKKIAWTEWQFDALHQQCLPAVMRPHVKKAVVDFFRDHCNVQQQHYTSVLHPSAVVSSTVAIGKGCFVEPGTVIASFASLGFAVTVNRGSTVGHHTTVGDFVSINPGVHIAGHCSIGAATQIGIGSVVFDHIKIGANSIIGGGSMVTKDIPDNVVAWGNPCKVIKSVTEA
jgi:sugar O-acyltransferase (sialic acid O-acetyltransferase NeuD family)